MFICNQLVVNQPFPKQQILDSSKLKEFADDKFRFDENDKKFSKKVENIVVKGEIACYKQFLRFSQCFFLKTCTADMSKPGLFGKGSYNVIQAINPFPHKDSF